LRKNLKNLKKKEAAEDKREAGKKNNKFPQRRNILREIFELNEE